MWPARPIDDEFIELVEKCEDFAKDLADVLTKHSDYKNVPNHELLIQTFGGVSPFYIQEWTIQSFIDDKPVSDKEKFKLTIKLEQL